MSTMEEKHHCYFCKKELDKPARTRFINGQLIDCCDECFKTAKVFVKGDSKNERARTGIEEIKQIV